MRWPGLRFSVRWLMIAVAIAALMTIVLPNPFGSDGDRHDTWCPPPQVKGEVLGVGLPGGRVELSVGSDDGLATGFEMFLWRDAGRSAPLGKVRVVSLGYDRSIGEVMEGLSGPSPSIRRGDQVSLHAR